MFSFSALSGPSLPSSSNSSAGPSSPTTASTPIDFLNKVKNYIIDNTKSETTETPAESDQTVSLANQNPASLTQTASQPTRAIVTTQQSTESNVSVEAGNQAQSSKQTGSTALSSGSGTPTTGTGHQSAFKVVNRSGSQKFSFKVSQVSEESLNLGNSTEKNPQAEKPPE